MTLQGDTKLSPIMKLYNYSICLEMCDYNKMKFKIIFEMTIWVVALVLGPLFDHIKRLYLESQFVHMWL